MRKLLQRLDRLTINKFVKAPLWSLFALMLLAAASQAATLPPKAAIASAHPLATDAGMQILQQGGNAFDAAVTVSAVLAVVEPAGSGFGGGGFWLLHRESDGKQVMVDGRQVAPGAATRDMYLDAAGNPVPGLSINGALSAGIPGHPAALVHLAEQYGVLPLGKSLAPAIKLAREGFPVYPHYQRMAGFRAEVLRADKAAANQFLVDGEVPPLGYLIKQPDLAKTLEAMAAHGREGFYAGDVARLLIDGVNAAGGIWTEEDLLNYRIIERQPVIGRYGDYKIVAASLPSSGGIVIMQMLNMLADLNYEAADPVKKIHLLTEVMRRAYRDRALYLGDPDFADVPINKLLSLNHSSELTADVDPEQATPSEFLDGDEGIGTDTTHFSVLDKQGNRVAGTLSINFPFGACMVAPGTGVLLNDEMDDFSKKPGVPNTYGLVGNAANAIEPGKRMLSSMTPTFVEGPDRIAILGTPGGSRIITMLLLGILEFVDGGSPDQWVARKRIHHQYLPDQLSLEPNALGDDQKEQLESMGHTLKQNKNTWGNMQAILWDRQVGEVSAASDPRRAGKAVAR